MADTIVIREKITERITLGEGVMGPPGPLTSTATGYPLTVGVNGQTVIQLPVIVTDPTKVGLYVNGVRQRYGLDWTVSGTLLTWLSPNFTLLTTDALEILI